MLDESEVVILIVDDKKQNLYALEHVLRKVPARVIQAMSGDEALALTLKHDFALAIVDVQMPGMDGYELAHMLLGDPATCRIPIIFVSAAYSDEQHRFQGYRAGAVDYIVKPFDPEVLLSKVSVFLELARYRLGLESLVEARTQALRESESKYRTLIENAYDIIQCVNEDGSFGLVSPSWERVLGYGATERRQMTAEQVIAPEARATTLEVIRSVIETRCSIVNFHSVLVAQDGTHVHVEGNVVPEVSATGEAAAQCFFRDVTERLRAEEERAALQRAEAESRAKSDFLARMSHEIRTPMNAILGYAQLLRREAGLTPRQCEHLDTINRSGEHLLSLINQVLDLARIEAGRMPINESLVDFGELLLDVERMFRLIAVERGLALHIHAAPNLPRTLWTDGGKVRQVLINLLGNAVKFTEIGGIEVRVSVHRPAGAAPDVVRMVLSVSDTGCGIEPESVEHIFDAFRQASAGTRKSGVGLGLTVSRQLARRMGGDLQVSSAPGRGSVFQFDFVSRVSEGGGVVELGGALAPSDAEGLPTLSGEGRAQARRVAEAVPAALRAAIRDAIENGYPDEIGVHIRQVAEHAPDIGRSLGALAERFDYGALLDLLSDEG